MRVEDTPQHDNQQSSVPISISNLSPRSMHNQSTLAQQLLYRNKLVYNYLTTVHQLKEEWSLNSAACPKPWKRDGRPRIRPR